MAGPVVRTRHGALVGLCARAPEECTECGAALPEEPAPCPHCAGRAAATPRASPPHRGGEAAARRGATSGRAERTEAAPAVAGAGGSAGAAVPSLIQLGRKTRNEWQLMPCPVCGPVCHTTNHFGEPVERLASAMDMAEAAARKCAWGKALEYFHVCIGALGATTPPSQTSAVHAGASRAQLKLGSSRSALRHATLAITACPTHAAAHARRAEALEALGELEEAAAAFTTAHRLDPHGGHEAAAARLGPLVALLSQARAGGGGGGRACVRAVEESAPPLSACGGVLLPLLVGGEWAHGRVVQLLSLDAAIEAAGGECAARAWLLRKARELGMDVLTTLLRESGEEREECGEEEEGRATPRAPNPLVSVEVEDSRVGRGVLQLELVVSAMRLTFSHTSLEPLTLGEVILECTFLVGLLSMCLVEAEGQGVPWCEFARWRPKKRGPLQLLDLPAGSSHAAKAVCEYFGKLDAVGGP